MDANGIIEIHTPGVNNGALGRSLRDVFILVQVVDHNTGLLPSEIGPGESTICEETSEVKVRLNDTPGQLDPAMTEVDAEGRARGSARDLLLICREMIRRQYLPSRRSSLSWSRRTAG